MGEKVLKKYANLLKNKAKRMTYRPEHDQSKVRLRF